MDSKTEKSINLFNAKCAKIDLPPECYPDILFLKKIFRQHLSFFEHFMQKVDTKYAVNQIKKNILVAQMNNSDLNVTSSSNHFPKEYQKYIKYRQLRDKLKELKERNHYLKHEEGLKLETLKKNDLKINQLKELSRLKKVKKDLMQAKLIDINQSIEEEFKLQKNIKDVTPAKFSSSNSIEDFCKDINESIEILKEFTAVSSNDENNSTKDKFWKKLGTVLKRVPNSVIFKVIINQITSKIEDSFISNASSTSESKEQPVKISEKILPYLHQIKIISAIELAAYRKKLELSKRSCADNIQIFEHELDGLINSSIDYSFQLEEDDIVAEFVSGSIAKLNLEGKIKYCTNNMEVMKQQVENNSSMLEYEQLVNDTKNIYNFINEKMTAVQEHVSQVHQINEKVNFSKISAMRMIQSLKIEKSQQHNRTLLNQTLNNTVIANDKGLEVSLPKHELEILQFLETPIILFDQSITMSRSMILNNEDVVSNMIQIAGYFTNPQKFLDILKKQIKFGNHIKSVSNSIASQIDTITDVNSDELQKQRAQNSEEISLMFDEISKFNVAIKSNLKNLDMLLTYSLENPLRKFVPKTKRFNGKSYENYEKEYMLYYKMIKN